MDKLECVFELQQKLDEDIMARRNLTHWSAQEWIQKDVLAMIAELGELLNEVNFKWWKNPKQIDQAAINEELVDVFHFFVSMCLRAGMNADDLFQGYILKNKENFDRQYGRSAKKGYDPFAADDPCV